MEDEKRLAQQFKDKWHACYDAADWTAEHFAHPELCNQSCGYCEARRQEIQAKRAYLECKDCPFKAACFGFWKTRRQYDGNEITKEQMRQQYLAYLAMVDEAEESIGND